MTKNASMLLIAEPPLQVLPSLAAIIGLNEAILLQQIHYWISNPKIGDVKNGKRWVRNSAEEWHSDGFSFWSVPTIRRVLNSLESKGLIQIDQEMNPTSYDRRAWYTIDYEKLNEVIDASDQDDQMGSDQDDQIETINMRTSYTKDSKDSNIDSLGSSDKPTAFSKVIRSRIRFAANKWYAVNKTDCTIGPESYNKRESVEKADALAQHGFIMVKGVDMYPYAKYARLKRKVARSPIFDAFGIAAFGLPEEFTPEYAEADASAIGKLIKALLTLEKTDRASADANPVLVADIYRFFAEWKEKKPGMDLPIRDAFSRSWRAWRKGELFLEKPAGTKVRFKAES